MGTYVDEPLRIRPIERNYFYQKMAIPSIERARRLKRGLTLDFGVAQCTVWRSPDVLEGRSATDRNRRS